VFKIRYLLMFILCFSFQLNAEENFSEQYNKMMDESFEQMSKGMTPEMKEKYKKQLELAKIEMAKYSKLSPEEREKIDEENQKSLKDPKKVEQFKKNLSNISEEEKAMLKIMVNNLNEEINTIKNPPIKNVIPSTNQRMEKLNIHAGTPNLLMIPDAKLAGLGNTDVSKLKERYSELESKVKQLNTLEINTYCSTEIDCMTIGYGQQLSVGGMADFIHMSKSDVNVKSIMTRLNQITEIDKEIQLNLKGFMYTGRKKEWPEVACIQNICREKLSK